MNRNRNLILVLLLVSSFIAFPQSEQDKALAGQLMTMADEILKSTKAENEARDNYEQAARLDPSNIRANYMAGFYRLITVHRGQSAYFFEQVKKLDANYRFDIDYLIGHAYHYQMNFTKAIEHYEMYVSRLNEQSTYRGEGYIALKDVNQRIQECKNGLEFIKEPLDVNIVNLGPNVNSEYDDFAPVFNEDESIIIFTSRRREGNQNEYVDDDNMPYEDIYFAYKNDLGWDNAENIGSDINTPFHDSNLTMSPDGTELYIYKEVGNGDIFLTSKDTKTELWEDPTSIGDAINTEEFTENSVTLSVDGNLMIFASNRFGGYGDFDLYYSTRDVNGNWQSPTNMGGVINTKFIEDGPFLDRNGKTLYFSSEGHKGMGGYDIFKSEYDSANNAWGAPVNIGYPINTADNDIFYITSEDGENAYYASIKDDGYGFLDIYKISASTEEEPVEEPVVEVHPVTVVINITDKKTGDPLDPTIKFTRVDNKSSVSLDQVSPGVYTTTIENEASENYILEIEMDGYIYETRALDIPGMREEDFEYERNIAMQKLVVNTTRVLRNIYFEFNKAVFLSESMDELNKLVKMMADNPSVTVEIGGHTDNVGNAAYNKTLSQKRADAVRNHLIENGIKDSRVTSAGYGEEKPLASNDDEVEGRELNRRVEFKVTGN